MTPLLFLVAGWLAGIVVAAGVSQPLLIWLTLAAVFLIALLLGRDRARLRLSLACLLAFALGGARYQFAQPTFDASTLAYYNGAQDVTLEGVVWEAPEVREASDGVRTHLRLRVETIHLPDAPAPLPVSGLMLVYAPQFSAARLAATGEAEWRYGDRLRIIGHLETPPEFEDFSYRDYLARQGVYSQMRQPRVEFVAAAQGQWFYQLVLGFKDHALQRVQTLFPEPHAALLQGILLGVESGLPADIREAFSITGTSHLIAISGFNVAVLVGLCLSLFSRWLGPNRGALLTIGVIAAYTLLVGAGASVVRAAIMGSLGLIGQRLGRSAPGLNLLAVAALLMTLHNPFTLWDVGFQLSAMATLGLIVYAGPAQTALKNWLLRFAAPARAEAIARVLGDIVLLTLAAQITTLPVLVSTFNQLSLIALIANIVILPVQPAVMILGGLALMLGLVWLPLGQFAAALAYPFVAYTLAFVQFFARLPGASFAVAVGLWPAALFYLALFGLTWLLRLPAEKRPAWWGRFLKDVLPMGDLPPICTGGLAALAVIAFLAWSAHFSLPEPGRLRVVMLDAGRGAGVLIQTPSGRYALIDGGPSGNALVRGLAQAMPLWANQLDLLVVAAPREEAIGGLPEALTRYTVRRALLTQAPHTGGGSAAYRALLETLQEQQIDVLDAASRPAFDLGDGAHLRVLADGESGSVLRLEYGRFSVLFALGAMPAGVEPATAVLIGAEAQPLEAWLPKLNPQIVLIAGDQLPSTPEARSLLSGRTVLQSSQDGAITLVTDGQQLWVETER